MADLSVSSFPLVFVLCILKFFYWVYTLLGLFSSWEKQYFHHYKIFLFILGNFLCVLKYAFPDITTTTPTLLWLLVWYYLFFCPLNLNLSVSLYSRGFLIVNIYQGPIYLSILNLYPWTGPFAPFIFKVIFDTAEFKYAILSFVSICIAVFFPSISAIFLIIFLWFYHNIAGFLSIRLPIF